MDSDESQDSSSGNDVEIDTYSINRRNKRFTKKRSPLSKSSHSSRSRSGSSEAQSLKSSDNERSNPQSPSSVENEAGNERKAQTPKSPDSNCDCPQSPNRIQTPSPGHNQSLSNNSSRSNSPQEYVTNNHRSSTPNGNNEGSQSAKSDGSQNSRKSKLSHDKGGDDSSDESAASRCSRDAHQAANLDDGNTSDFSTSTDDSDCSKQKKSATQPEEISDGDLSEQEKLDNEPQNQESKRGPSANISITHEDLSDVSDLEDSVDHSDDAAPEETEHGEESVSGSTQEKRKKVIERSNQREDVEEQLDFEAEDGECAENENSKEKEDKNKSCEQELGELEDDGKVEKKDELEEGELTDEDDARPEETEPRPVCRFFSRGQCTWGASCRFLHPGVTDKGNYTMFDLVRPVVPGDYGNDRLLYSGRSDPPQMESAWERGLRTAKEMMRKSIKRKEQDIDFEEKKMNLSLAQEEFDKENGYYAKAPSPEPSRYVTVRPIEYSSSRVPHDEYYGRRQVVYEPDYVQYSRERVRTYREVPPYRQPDYYSKHDEESQSVHPKVKRPKREVIVQRAEERASGRGDEWSDPWMRSKSPAGRKSGRRQSYSSGSSYSSSSSSRSSSGSSKSSYKSRGRPKRSDSHSHRRQVSPSVIVSERKAANERAALMNPPAPRKKAPSPGMMRVGAQNPPAPSKFDQFGRSRTKLVAALARVKGQTHSSRSSSGSSSGSSSSDSDSSGSSSSSSKNTSPPRRPTSVDLAMALKAKAIDALKSGTEKRQIKLNLKGAVPNKKAEFPELSRKPDAIPGKKRTISPPVSDRDSKNVINKKASSRREELLKQLKAVEDAIAKKRSKPN